MKKIFMLFSLFSLFLVAACSMTTTTTKLTTTTTTQQKTTTTTTQQQTTTTTTQQKTTQTTTKGVTVNPSLSYRKSISLKDDNVPLKVIQYADLHFGIEGNDYHNDKENRTRLYMEQMAENKKPDLIVCSGDNILGTGLNGLKKFVEHMESLKTPWVFMYGNHDHEGNSSKKALNDYLISAETEYLIYDSEFIDTDGNRYGNFSLQILNQDSTKLLGALIFLDAGTYDYSKADYQSITTKQIEWYQKEIDFLQYVYSAQENNIHEVVPTIVFSHIQLPEFHTAYVNAKENKGNASFVIEQELNATSINEIKSGGPVKENTGFYEVLKAKKSTKAYFVGHAHLFYFQVKMDDIVLGFAPQSGFSKLFAGNNNPRKTYMYHLSPDFSFTTEQVDENYVYDGLAYTSSAGDGEIKVNEEGKYVVTLTFALWGRVEFNYKGTLVTIENTNITGEYSNKGAQWDSKLYTEGSISTLICCNSTGGTYIFTYDPETNTLDIKTKVQEAPEGSLNVGSKDADAGNPDVLNVFTKAGTKLRTVTNADTGAATWVGNGWRLYLVMDSEGKICYAVVYPPNGYGGPNGNGYYCHPDYADYTTNPAVVTLPGYGPYVSGGFVHNLFEIVVPEGGFAITCHTNTLIALVNALKGTELTSTSGIDKLLNNKTSFSEDIRITYDETQGSLGAISITTVEKTE